MTVRLRRGGRLFLAGAVLALVLMPASASAQDGDKVSFETRGEAAGADEAARGRALDLAITTEVERALRSLVSDKDRSEQRAALDKGVVRRARLFVSSYRVVSEKADGGRTQVVVAATVDLARLRSTLTELKVPVAGGSGGSGGSSPGPSGEGSGPAAILLLKVTTPDGSTTSFGRGGGDGGAAGEALAREITATGLRVRPAGGEQIAVSTGEGDPLLPVGDEAALDIARRLGAAAVWVVGIDVRAEGAIRGTRLSGAVGRGKLRVLDAERREVIAEAEAEGAGFDRDGSQAADAAARDLAQRLAGGAAGKVDPRWSAAASAGGPQVVVRVRGARTWASIGALIHKLSTTTGVEAVHAREVVRGRIALGVETRLAPARVATALAQARLPSGTLAAQARGERGVDVEIRGDTVITGAEDSGDAGPE